MALAKTIPLPFKPGWTAEYIRVDQLTYHRREKVLEIVLGYYPDEDCAIGERPPVGVDVIRLQGEEAEVALAALHDEAGPLVYSLIKGRPEYADATNT